MMQLLSFSDYKKMPWKNGAGYTLELARSAGQDLAAFDWRISMADVTTSGAFSPFFGMQRLLTVLEGEGIDLHIEDQTLRLNAMQTAQFGGEQSVSCDLVAGAIRDFNLIYDPDKYAARYQWIHTAEPLQFFSAADVIFLFNHAQCQIELCVDGQDLVLDAQQSLLIQAHQKLHVIEFKAAQFRQCCLIELTKN
ncbi:HutD/Ves family protein [Acinetobacter sp. GXMZU3951]